MKKEEIEVEILRYLHAFNNKKAIIFGTGNASKNLSKRIANQVAYYVDNDRNKWGDSFLGIEIKNPEVLTNEPKDEIIVIIASMYFNEISIQLNKLGLEEYLHFWDVADLLINPLDKKVKLAIEEEANKISDKCLRLINNNMLEDALAMLDEYQKIVPLDNRIRYLKSLISLKQGELSSVENMILEGLDLSNISVRTHQQLHEVKELERNEKYLKAIELCEDMFIQSGDLAEKRILADRITSLEENYRDEIQKQLEEKNIEYDTGGNYYLHLMIDNFYNEKFIKFIQEKFNKEEHVFIVFSNGSLKYMTLHENMYVFSYDTLNSKEKGQTILDIVSNSKSIFIHFLSDPICRFLTKNKINKKINWIIWGGDLYPYIPFGLFDKHTITFLKNKIELTSDYSNEIDNKIMVQRKRIIRNLSNILTWNKGDYELVTNNFVTNAKHREFFYPNPVDIELLNSIKNTVNYLTEDLDFKSKFKYVFLLGNSGTPTNNHLEVINYFERFKGESFCLVTPLSYGDPVYIQEIIKEGKRVLGDHFISLNEFLSPNDYAKILCQVDVVFLNHKRQQGVGNLLALLLLGKKVFLNFESTTYNTFKSQGVTCFDISKVYNYQYPEELIHFSDSLRNSNIKKIKENYGDKKCKDNLIKLFTE